MSVILLSGILGSDLVSNPEWCEWLFSLLPFFQYEIFTLVFQVGSRVVPRQEEDYRERFSRISKILRDEE